MYLTNNQDAYEAILAAEGMPAELPPEDRKLLADIGWAHGGRGWNDTTPDEDVTDED